MNETMIPTAETAGTEDSDTAWIRKRVHQKADLYRHVMVYVVVGAVLAAIDLLTSPQRLWFYWPMGFWAIGLVLNFLDVYVMGEGAGMEKRMLERELRRHHSSGR